MRVGDISQLPLKSQQRKCTDQLCLFVYAVLSVLLFVVACARLNIRNLKIVTYPVDIDGRTCGGPDLPDYPYLYYTSLQDPAKRLCLKKCPIADEWVLDCSPARSLSCKKNYVYQHQVQIYESVLTVTRLGLFCMPINRSIKQRIRSFMTLDQRFQFLKIFDALLLIICMSGLAGVAMIVITHQKHKGIIRPSVVLGSVFLLFLSVYVVFHTSESSNATKYALATVLTILAGLLIYNIITRPSSLYVHGSLLRFSTFVSCNSKYTFLYIPLFFVLSLSAILFFSCQMIAVWSSSDISFNPNAPFYSLISKVSKILTLVYLFQLVWTLCILKESYNYLLAGEGANWYLDPSDSLELPNPLSTLMCKHFGSVIAGAFLEMVFWLPSLFLNSTIRGKPQILSLTSAVSKCFYKSLYFIQTFTNLYRSESHAFIHLSGVPYCNASRYTQMLSFSSESYLGSQSLNKIYLLSIHSLVMSICLIVALFYLQLNGVAITVSSMLLMAMVSYFLVQQGLGFHSAVADGVAVALLLEEYLVGGFQMLNLAPIDLREEVFVLPKTLD